MAADTMPRVRSRESRRKSRRQGAREERGCPAAGFVLYVEGPRDRDLLRIWARRLGHDLARALDRSVVIMGGRQPARAAGHFASVRARDAAATGLVVLDRDHHDAAPEWPEDAPLDLYTWPRRHIESYVLVPAAIRRAAGCAPADARVDRLLAEHLPEGVDGRAGHDLDAKRLLGSKGPLARTLGRTLSSADIARCMRADEVHADVVGLLGRTRTALGLSQAEPEIVVRSKLR